MTPDPSLRAVCDPLLVANLILSDTALYADPECNFRLATDPVALNSWFLASLLFDQFLSQPVFLVGLEPVLGSGYSERIGRVLRKLQDAEFVEFNTEKYIPDDKKTLVNSVLRFLNKVDEAEHRVDELAGRLAGSVGPPYGMITFSRATNFPLFTTNEALLLPSILRRTATTRPRVDLLSQVLELELPVVQVENLDDLLDMRQSYGASEFRKVFHTFYRSLEAELSRPDAPSIVNESWAKIKNDALDLLIKEFRTDITAWQTVKAGGSIALDLAGFIPGASLITGSISALKSTKELLDQRAKVQRAKDVAWLCFLTELRSRSAAKR